MTERFCVTCGKPNYNQLNPGQRWTCTYCDRFQSQVTSDRPWCGCGRSLAVWVEATFSGRSRPPRVLCHDCVLEYTASDTGCTVRVLPEVIADMVCEPIRTKAESIAARTKGNT